MNTDKNLGTAIKVYRLSVDKYDLIYTLYKLYDNVEERYCYSISVSMTEGAEWQSEYAYDISSCEESSVEIFTIISEGEVFPCTLLEVLEDIL